MAIFCKIKKKATSIHDAAAAIFANRTYGVQVAAERYAAASGIPVPENANVQVSLDALHGSTANLIQQDQADFIDPLNAAVLKAADAAGQDKADFKANVSAYASNTHIIERVKGYISGLVGGGGNLSGKYITRNTYDKATRHKILELKKQYLNKDDVDSKSGQDILDKLAKLKTGPRTGQDIVDEIKQKNKLYMTKVQKGASPQETERLIDEILMLQEELFDPANEATYFHSADPKTGVPYEPGHTWRDQLKYQGTTIADAEANLQDMSPEYGDFYENNTDLFDAMRDKMNERRTEAGRNGPVKEFERAVRGWRYYLPFKNTVNPNDLESFFDDLDIYEATGFLNEAGEQRLVGRTTQAADPLAQLEVDLLRSGSKIGSSKVEQSLANFYETYLGSHSITKQTFNMTKLASSLFGKDVISLKGKRLQRKPNTFTVHNGDTVDLYTIGAKDKDLFVGLKSYWDRSSDAADAVYRYTMRPIAMAKTYLNPPWSIFTNGIREFRQQFIYGTLDLGFDESGKFTFTLSKEYLKNVLAFRGAIDAVNYSTRDFLGKRELEAQGSPYAKWANLFTELGGASTFIQSLGLQDVNRKLEDLYEKALTGGIPTDVIKRNWKKTQEWYAGVFDGIEMSTRVALFKAIVETGRLSPQEAAVYVKNLMNFNHRGKAGDVLRALYIFYGPSAAGVFRMLHSVFKVRNPAQMAAFGIMYTSASAFAYALASAMAGQDDDGEDKFKGLSDDTVLRNDMLPVLGDNKSVGLIPVALGLEAMLRMPGVLAMRLAMGHTTPARATVAAIKTGLDNSTFVSPADPGDAPGSSDIMTSLALTFMPSLFRPGIETIVNQDSNGLQIWNKYLDENKPYYMQGRDNTDGVFKIASEALYNPAKAAGQASNYALGTDFDWGSTLGIDVTPETIKHLFSQYGGFLSSTTNRFLTYNDKVLRGDPITASDIPFMPTISTKDIIYYPQRSFSQVRGEWETPNEYYQIAIDEKRQPTKREAKAHQLETQVKKYDRKIGGLIDQVQNSQLTPQEKGRRVKALLDQRALIRLQLTTDWQESNK